MVAILMISAKLAALGILKTKVIWKKGYYVIVFVLDVSYKILSRDSNCIVDLAMWPKIGNSSFSMEEALITSIL